MIVGEIHIWEMRNPDGGMLGLEFARAQMAPADVVLAHATPERVDIEIRDGAGRLVARASRLRSDGATPMSRFTVADGGITRENVWPGEEDIGRPVVLPGGEVGILTAWWNAEDHREWRWSIELHNRVEG
jgi:hypothetical protein